MPIIPLLRPAGPLANAPAPVLDNQRRPTVNRGAEMNALGNVAQSARAVMVDPNAVSAPYRALGAVGQAIAQGGDVLSAVVIKARETETDRQVMEWDNTVRDALGQHDLFMEQNPKAPETWKKNLDDTLAGVRRGIDSNDKLHPAARQRIAMKLGNYTTNAGISTGMAVIKQNNALVKDGAIANALRKFAVKDYEGGIAGLKEAEAKGYLWSHEVAGYEADVVRYKKQDAEQAKRDVNELEVRKFNSARNLAIARASNEGEEGVLKDLEEGKMGDLSPFDQERVRGAVQEVTRDRSAAVMDDVITAIQAGEIKNEAGVHGKAGPFFGPKLIQQALGMVKQRNTLQQKQDVETNGVRNAVALRLDIMEYDSSKDPDRTQYFKLRERIAATVPEDYASDLDADLKTRYGVLPPDVKVRPELQKNVSDLISANYDPQHGAVPWRFETEDGYGRKFTRVDQAEREKALNAEANVRKQMDDWFRANPDKVGDFKAAREKLSEVLPGGTRARLLDGIKAKALGQQGAGGETGPAGVEFAAPPSGTRVTSYAYDNDETPDSNSSAGIGAFVPASEQAKIKRGEDSPYRLKEGDFAVSPDVERSLKSSGIRPGDEVEIQFADGSVQTGRWMDRTADNLRGRWDFYQGGKRSKHGKEGGKVTGFRRPD